MHVDVTPRHLPAAAGTTSEAVVTLTNTRDVIAGFAVRVLGVDPSWVHVADPQPRLFPGASASVRVALTLPADAPAGRWTVGVEVQDLADPAAVAVHEVVLEVPAVHRTRVVLEPPTVTAGRQAVFTAVVHNDGNTPHVGGLTAVDPEARTTFAFVPATVTVPPRASTSVTLTARARRPWAGDPVLRPFEVRTTGTHAPGPDAPPAATGVFLQRPRFTRGAIALVGLLAAVTVFATVIALALGTVVQRSAADRDLALEVAQARDSAATTGTAGLSGTVLELTTGTVLGGVSVEVVSPDDTTTAVATAATTQDGAFAVGGLADGSYLLRVRGAGFAEVWYPAAATADDATAVDLADGAAVDGLVVVVGGVPATLAGTVTGDDVGGATVQVQMPLDAAPLLGSGIVADDAGTPGEGVVVRTVPVGEDGTVEIADVPSPAVYDLVVTKPGYATHVQRVDVAAGESRAGLELPLLLGDGTISGTVSGGAGPLGGASVVASSATVRVETVSLTQDGVGSFVLRGLPTPGTYTVVVSADGRAPATLTLTLTAAQELTGVDVVLGDAQGTLGGTVAVPGGDPGGVEVTVTDGASTWRTAARSGSGSWRLAGVPVPGTYTVTFAHADLQSQVLSVSIDGFGRVTSGAASAGGLDVTMRSASGTLSGTVRQLDGAGGAVAAGNVTVQVASGTVTRTVTTASTPAAAVGAYAVDALPPGTYTVTFTRAGTRSVSQIVVVQAGQDATLSPVLVRPAAVTGTVRRGNDPLAGAGVRLYRASDYGLAGAAPVATTTTDANGVYAFDDVDAPQNYLVEVRVVAGGSVVGVSPPFTLAASEQRAVDVTS
ncbi:carboxypeptidase regulatory-like domain-containing protein [Cellulomonas wangsupingiae]|uniref:alpha-amylase n=1 Tax=Cellulomonas wangsupingiae TaxID=2968085 RepID=A0ABY5KCB3_9CELL|nr:carboxypeptidase regulatory-like domain-containing protein [Cellulomonas wangsupingiae]MCC2336485.1 carboxypeptidase regulatory-like domain-containing protein [Cellulomonas wangsupingiae]MCM0640825.1 carboxypeptidase regulatory-like domain-containing protein [Cellulomonas wangsupingiae]UUI67091.1 carboxypeptidase regulatory-like domain-containing protein [Cellulomonas wangsupingiae]